MDSGCLSKAQIDEWAKRVDKSLIELPDGEVARKLLELINRQPEQYAWLDVIDAPPHVWVDPARVEQGQTPLGTVLGLLE